MSSKLLCFFRIPRNHSVLRGVRRLLFAASCLLGPLSAVHAASQVAVTIQPLAHVLAALTLEPATADLIIENNQDPHHLVLRPSDRKAMAQADLLVWIGPALELPLQKVIRQKIAEQESVIITVQDLQGIGLIMDGRQPDPHLWLDTDNVAILANAVSAELQRIDPDQTVAYQNRLQAFLLLLSETQAEISTMLASVAGNPWAVEHHAYRYFARQFGLAAPATLKDSDNNEAGVRSSLSFRAAIREQKLSCVVTEAGSNPRELQELLDQPELVVVSADILGLDVAVSETSYRQLMLQLASDIQQCTGVAHER